MKDRTNEFTAGQHFAAGRKQPPEVIVLHYDETYSAEYAIGFLKQRRASAHFCIERDGTPLRCVRDNNRAWHAGRSSWLGRAGVNNFSLGIEISNLGWMDHDNVDARGGFVPTEFRAQPQYAGRIELTSGRTILSPFPVTRYSGHPWRELWENYSDAAIDSTIKIVAEWMSKFNILPENVVGHEHVSPGRKVDPGPAFGKFWAQFDCSIHRHLPESAQKLVDPTHRVRDRVRALQSYLEALDVSPGTIDGLVGPATVRALREAIEAHPTYLAASGAPGIESGMSLTPQQISAWCSYLRYVPHKEAISRR